MNLVKKIRLELGLDINEMALNIKLSPEKLNQIESEPTSDIELEVFLAINDLLVSKLQHNVNLENIINSVNNFVNQNQVHEALAFINRKLFSGK
jgi:DNA-binding XRE family transcriptional regulator